MTGCVAVEEGEFLKRICPDGVTAAVSYADTKVSAEHPAEAQWCADFHEQRKAEFLCGRACARKALSEIGLEEARLSSDSNGVPQWPNGYVGSITHSKGLCGAVAAKEREYLCLGLDFERSGRLSDSAAKRVVHAKEVSFASSNPEGATLLFSLKEAFYKAQFPRWQIRANFQDVAFSFDAESGSAEIIYMSTRFAELAADAQSKFKFYYAQKSGLFGSLCCLENNA